MCRGRDTNAAICNANYLQTLLVDLFHHGIILRICTKLALEMCFMNTAIIIIEAIAIVCVYTYIQLKLPSWKGRVGELQVSRKLHSLSSTQYTTINDLILPSKGNTNATQIDHIVVSNFGVFCIETKAYKGWIFGSAKQKY